MTDRNDLTTALAGLTPREVADVIKGAEHARRARAENDGVEAIAALFERNDKPTADFIGELDEAFSGEGNE